MRRLFGSKIFIIVFLSLLLITIAGLSVNENSRFNWLRNVVTVPLAPAQKAVNSVDSWVNEQITFFKDIKKFKKENEQLKKLIAQLEKENLTFSDLERENKELRKALNFKDRFAQYDSIGSNIISKESGNWFYNFTIDCGLKDGVKLKSPVVTGDGLVGRVIQSDLISAKVMSIIDLDSSVSARLVRSREPVILRGDVKLMEQGLCRLDYIPQGAEVQVGDLVETAGLGGVFPKEIIIGQITEIIKTEGQLDYYAIVKPMVDFKRIEEVIVFKEKDINLDGESNED